MHENHPVGIPFRGYRSGSVPKERSAGFATPMQEEAEAKAEAEAEKEKKEEGYLSAGSGKVGGKQIWWVSASGSSRRQRGDLPLYARDMGDGVHVPNVECASCHDPHNTSAMFLRMSNAGSRLCLTCHNI